MLFFTISLFLMGSFTAKAQEDPKEPEHKITLSAYVDAYLATYSNELPQQEFQPYITASPRGNSFSVNIAQFGIHYEHDKMRGNFVYHIGDIPQATWSSDFTNLQAANVGVKITDGLWLDAGFFTTHIGMESFMPKNNMLSSTAYITYNEPFYQAGAKLSYQAEEKWYFELWGLNGYNNFVDNNDAKSIGALINYAFSDNTSLTYTNIYGRESEDGAGAKQKRFYHNIYLNQNWNDKALLTIGFDYGTQTNSDLNNPDKTATMYGALATLRYQFNPKFSITGRGEIFNDENGFISGTMVNTQNEITGLQLAAFTLGMEYRPIDNAYVRAEGRYTAAKDDLEIFINDGKPTNKRYALLLTMGFYISEVLGF